jgi:hypothetical protein
MRQMLAAFRLWLALVESSQDLGDIEVGRVLALKQPEPGATRAGETSQARDLLLKAMDALHLEEPNSEVWFGFALIAERYGFIDAAEKMYSRVEKPKVEYPDTSYVIAQQHLALLRGIAGSSAKVGSQQW